ncbi:MAG: hypothetical protein ABIN01_07020 [Ferruginibacter sp.]
MLKVFSGALNIVDGLFLSLASAAMGLNRRVYTAYIADVYSTEICTFKN